MTGRQRMWVIASVVASFPGSVALAQVAPSVSAALPPSTVTAAPRSPALKDVFAGAFMIGAALSPRQFEETDRASAALIKHHFNTISPENVLKWEVIHPAPDIYSFGPADRYVAFGERNGMFIIGHTLAWHSQTPRWVFEDAQGRPLTRDALLARLREHIQIVVGRYRGRIKGWDVVNEALNEDGSLRESPWYRIIGPDYIAKAFQYAHEADPAAELYYNDYSMERAEKRAGGVRLVKALLDAGIPIRGVGMQDHLKMDRPSIAEEDSTITAFAALGVRVNISELDVDVLPAATRDDGADVALRAAADSSLDPYRAALPDSMQQALARRYADMFRVFLKHRAVIDRVTFWGLSDGDSWLNGWPIRGRTNYPLLFDRHGSPKPAFDAITRLVVPSS